MPHTIHRTYDEWKLDSPEQEELASECDACGKLKYGCIDLTYMGMDVHACPQCRFEDDDGERLQ